jgi:hypothetical protein
MLILFPDNPEKKFREVSCVVRPNELKKNGMVKDYVKAEATAGFRY